MRKTTTISYTINIAPTVEEVIRCFERSGINRPTKDTARIQGMLDHSNLIICARTESGELVGISRALTDFSYCCYLSDLAVEREYQRSGIGKHLIEETQKACGEQVMLILLAAPSAMEYYPHIGFNEIGNAWGIPRKN